VHWAVLALSGLFFLWNPWWAGMVMIAYAAAANLPCILIQRYNHLRLARAIAARSGKRGREPTVASSWRCGQHSEGHHAG
jgi:glycosyl-4,4'-diaponeurosporenoate acyltransferase